MYNERNDFHFTVVLYYSMGVLLSLLFIDPYRHHGFCAKTLVLH